MKNATLVLFGLVLGVLLTCSRPQHNSNPSSTSAVGDAQAAPAVALPGSLADVAEKAVPSVVNISATQVLRGRQLPMHPFMDDPFFRHFFGDPRGPNRPREQKRQSLGSGVIVSDDGVILTNNHVIQHAEEIVVTLSDGTDMPAEVVGSDAKTDLAVLRVEGENGNNLQPIQFGSSSDMRLGDVVLAIGNPFGVGQTVTMGIVSAKGRSKMGIVDYEDFIQTDAAINPGNSGGALINTRGELVGINTAILSRTGGYQGIGFAIPTDMARPILDSLLEDGVVERGWLGVAIQDLDDDLAEAMGLDVTEGVLISDVTPGSPAEKAGLKRGDVVVGLNGREVLTSAILRNRIAALGPGGEAKLKVVRDGSEKTVDVKLGSLEDGEKLAGKTQEVEGLLSGISVANITNELRRKYGIADRVKGGVVVTGVEPGSSAQSVGLREGDVIVELNRKPVTDLKAFEKAYAASERSVLLLVNRKGTTLYLALRR